MYVLLRDSGRLSSLRNHLRVKKARAKLREQVKVTEAAEAPRKAEAAKKAPEPHKKKAEEAEPPKRKATRRKGEK
jgi:hypothetical protein